MHKDAAQRNVTAQRCTADVCASWSLHFSPFFLLLVTCAIFLQSPAIRFYFKTHVHPRYHSFEAFFCFVVKILFRDCEENLMNFAR